MKKSITDTIEEILGDIYELDPTLKEREAEVRRLVETLASLRPDVSPSPAFIADLRERLLSAGEEAAAPVASKTAWLSLFLRLAAPVAVAALFLFMLLPSATEGPVVLPDGVSLKNAGSGGGGEGTAPPESSFSMQYDSRMSAGTEAMDSAVSLMNAENPSLIETRLGFIRFVDTRTGTMWFDDASWLSGIEAENAAIAHGLCTEATRDECLPNGYFIENTDRMPVQIVLAPSLTIFMQTWNAGQSGVLRREIPLQEFARLIQNESLHWNKLPYTITLKGQTVVSVEEVYIP